MSHDHQQMALQRMPVAMICAQSAEGEVFGRSFPLWTLLDGELDMRTREQMSQALIKAQDLLGSSPELDAEGADAFAMPVDGRRVFFVACPAQLPLAQLQEALARLPESMLASPMIRMGNADALSAAQRCSRDGSLAADPKLQAHWQKVDIAGHSALRDHEADKALGQNALAHFEKGDRLLSSRRQNLAKLEEIAAKSSNPEVLAQAQARALLMSAPQRGQLEPDQAARDIAQKIQSKRRFLPASGAAGKSPLLIINFKTNYTCQGMASMAPLYDYNAAVFPLLDILPGRWDAHLPQNENGAKELCSKTKIHLGKALAKLESDPKLAWAIPNVEKLMESLTAEFANGRWMVLAQSGTEVFWNIDRHDEIRENIAQSIGRLGKTSPAMVGVGEQGFRACDLDLVERLGAGEPVEKAKAASQWSGASRGWISASASESDRQIQSLREHSEPLLALIAKHDLSLASLAPKVSSERPGL